MHCRDADRRRRGRVATWATNKGEGSECSILGAVVVSQGRLGWILACAGRHNWAVRGLVGGRLGLGGG